MIGIFAEPILYIQNKTEAQRFGGYDLSERNCTDWCGKSKKSTAELVLPIQSEIEEETSGGDELSDRDCNVWRGDIKIKN